MARAKCRQCGEQESPKYMVPMGEGRDKKYVHPHCKEAYEESQATTKRELAELEDLIVNYVSKVHKTTAIPPSYYPLVQDLRNGTIRRGKIVKKQYKEGFSFPTIAKAYQEHWKKIYDRIHWSKAHGYIKNASDEFRIGLNVISEQIALVQEGIINRQQADRIQQDQEKERANLDLTELVPTEKKLFRKQTKKAHDDITEFLDD